MVYLIVSFAINSHTFVFWQSAEKSLIALENFDVRTYPITIFGEERNGAERDGGQSDWIVMWKNWSVAQQTLVVVEVAVLWCGQPWWATFHSEHLQTLVDGAKQLRVEKQSRYHHGGRISSVHTVNDNDILDVPIQVVIDTLAQGVTVKLKKNVQNESINPNVQTFRDLRR